MLADIPNKAFKDLQQVFSKFLIPENIPAEAAMPQIANPRAPEVAFPYRRTGYAFAKEPLLKRAHVMEKPSSDPSTNTLAETATGTKD